MFDIVRTARHTFLGLLPERPDFLHQLKKWETVVRCCNSIATITGHDGDVIHNADCIMNAGDLWAKDRTNLALGTEYAEALFTEMFNNGVTMDVHHDTRIIIREEMLPSYSNTCEVFCIRFYVLSRNTLIDQGAPQYFDKWSTLELVKALRERVLSDNAGRPTNAGLEVPGEPLHKPYGPRPRKSI